MCRTFNGDDRWIDESPADEQLRQRVEAYLVHTGHAPAQRLQVRATNGVVMLSGQAPTYYIRQLALACAQRVAGVQRVVDEIQVYMPEQTGRGPYAARSS